MPQYKVKSPGFFDGRLYDPQGKRPVLHTDKPFTKNNPMPHWLTEVAEETAAEKKKRKAEAKAAEEKAKQDEIDIANAASDGDGKDASFLDKVKGVVDGNSSKVETI